MASFNRQLSSGQGRKNVLINGNFDIWQRAGALTAGTGSRYCADRWGTFSINTTMTPSRQGFTIGQISVPNNPKYFHRTVVASVAAAGNYGNFAQLMEDVTLTSGKTLTLSFWAKVDAAKNIAIEFSQHFGTGGSPSTRITGIGVTTCALTTTFQQFTVTATMPSVSGKTLGTDGNSYLSINFWFDAGSTFNDRTNSLGQQSGTFDIAQVQIEQGSIATDFEQRSYGEELMLCQRYYEKSYPQGTNPGAVNFLTGALYHIGMITNPSSGRRAATIPYKVTKRGIPAVTTYDYAGNASKLTTLTSAGNVSASVTPTLLIIGDSSFLAYIDSSSDSGVIINWAADAEL